MATGTQVGNDVAFLVEVHVGSGRQRRFFTEIKEGLAPVCQLNGHEAASAQVACCGIDHRQRVTHGDRRIDGITATFQYVDADMGGQMLRGDHHAVFCGNRCHRRRVSHETAECQ
ncbi:hypothetical protein D3C78_1394210 [compost metagenome]